MPMLAKQARFWTRCDPVLSKVRTQICFHCWLEQVAPELKPFSHHFSELSVEDNRIIDKEDNSC